MPETSADLKDLHALLDSCNHGELVHLARLYGHRIGREVPKEQIVGYLMAEAPTKLDGGPSPIDTIRGKVKGFVAKHWNELAPILTCNGNCHAHSDGRAVQCYMDNPQVKEE